MNTLPKWTIVNESQEAFAFALYQLDDSSLTLEDVLALDTDLPWARAVDEDCSMIKRGGYVPHPKHWNAFAELVRPAE